MAGSAFATSTQSQSMSEMNITPLVDVMLVLLVIFMIAAPAVTAPLQMQLPQAGPMKSRPLPERMTLEITHAGEYRFDGRTLDASGLRTAAIEVARQAPATIIEIRASADADYQGFATALAAARNAGLTNVSLPN